MSTAEHLKRLFAEIVNEARTNEGFARRLQEALDASAAAGAKPPPTGRRQAAIVNPYTALTEGEGALRDRLNELDLEALKDIIAEYQLDPSRLAMKWKRKERVVDLILETVLERKTRGSAFRGP